MYEKINITENHLLALALLTERKDVYIRELQREIKISPRTAQTILQDLEEKGVLESHIRGKIRIYSKTKNAKRYLLLAEQYKTLTFFQTNPLIKELIEKIIPYINGAGIIFGSYAKGTQGKTSDLDIMILGTCTRRKIEKIAEAYGVEINLKVYTSEIFGKKDPLAIEVLKNHVVFADSGEFSRWIS